HQYLANLTSYQSKLYPYIVTLGDFFRDDCLTKWEGDFGLGKDGADFLIWQRNFSSPPLSSGISVVPEPSSLVLFTLAGLGYMACRKRRSNL
ncbi:MAG: PEP-CTERM sorting domain-containing protein, partial [Planctomycetes bacterium]|nr:PEP-CTERM sorting domain-containing protein [Planctomycetota bacterium]